jgi:hypothetical protein
MTTNKDAELKGLAKDLRRLLYLNQAQTFTIQSILENPICQPILKDIIKKQINAMNYVRDEIKRRDHKDTWKPIQNELDSDRMHDIAVHIDFISDIANLAEITDILQEHYNEQLKAKQHAKA